MYSDISLSPEKNLAFQSMPTQRLNPEKNIQTKMSHEAYKLNRSLTEYILVPSSFFSSWDRQDKSPNFNPALLLMGDVLIAPTGIRRHYHVYFKIPVDQYSEIDCSFKVQQDYFKSVNILPLWLSSSVCP